MGVYVKGMKFPDSCCVCPIMNQDDGYCEVNHDRADDIWNRPEWCPMVEVPTPHGRLIDGSELVVKYDLYAPIAPVVEGDSEHWTNLIHTRHILNAPTVIKAEDE